MRALRFEMVTLGWLVVTLSCNQPPALTELEDVAQLSDTLTVRVRGAAVSQKRSATDKRHHLLKLSPHSPSLIIDLEHMGCETERVSVLIPQALPYATVHSRVYLGGQSERTRAIQRALPGLTWTRDPAVEDWTPLSDRREGSITHPSGRASLVTFELQRGSVDARQVLDSDPPTRALIESIASERWLTERALPEPTSLPPSAPCVVVTTEGALSAAPLMTRLTLNLYDRLRVNGVTSDETGQTRVGVVSGLRWSQARQPELLPLYEQLNEAQLDVVVLLGDLTAHRQVEELEGLTRALGALDSPWVVTRGDQDKWVGAREWLQRLGFTSFGFDRGPLRLGVLDTVRGVVGGEGRALLERWGQEEGLLWPQRAAPQLKLLLSHLPLLPTGDQGDSVHRSEAIRLLNLSIESGMSHLLSAEPSEPHPGLRLITAPDLSQDKAWLEVLVTARCQQGARAEGCLVLTPHLLE